MDYIDLQELGRQQGSALLEKAVTSAKNQEQMANQLEITLAAAIHIVGAIAYNDIHQGDIGEMDVIMEMKERIEDELEWINEQGVEFIEPGGSKQNSKHKGELQ